MNKHKQTKERVERKFKHKSEGITKAKRGWKPRLMWPSYSVLLPIKSGHEIKEKRSIV